MAMRSGMYSSKKRQKELIRQKKQEEKRLKRQNNAKAAFQQPEAQGSMNIELGSPGDMPAVTDKPANGS